MGPRWHKHVSDMVLGTTPSDLHSADLDDPGEHQLLRNVDIMVGMELYPPWYALEQLLDYLIDPDLHRMVQGNDMKQKCQNLLLSRMLQRILLPNNNFVLQVDAPELCAHLNHVLDALQGKLPRQLSRPRRTARKAANKATTLATEYFEYQLVACEST
jgi:hypothetical protein